MATGTLASRSLTCSAGFARMPSDGESFENVMEHAEFALSSASDIHGSIRRYTSEMHDSIIQESNLEAELTDAVMRNELTLYYQPKVSLLNNEVIGAEALCRWIRDGKVVPPDQFIPVLERSKLICDLDFYMLEHVCRDIRGWIDMGGKPVEISTNFSRMHLNNPNLSRQIVEIINRYDIPHELIIVELTETTSSVHMKRMGELVSKLKDEGIRTSVDDFGVGYSSMSMLRDIPFSEIKTDRSFLTYTTDTRDRSAVMMKHVISMASELGMRCIAEGVETPDQIRMLKEMDCLRAQGFYFDKPLPKEAFMKRLRMRVYSEKLVN
jgi:EAL domain-containing protein (putative c-di-GMP-specific phosphodiesterase class I)